MEVSTIVSLAIYAVTILTVLIGFLFGLWKGLKKASLRLGVFLVFLVISALISQPITKAILKINVTIGGNTASITDQIVNLLCSIEVIDGFYQSSSAFAQLINVIPVALINCIVFILLTLILSLIGYFVYLILAAIFIKRNKKPYAVKNGNTVVVADYKSEKKYRLLGGLIGGVQSFIFIFVLFMPITAIFSTFADLSQSTTTKVAYASTQTNNDLTPTSKLLRENLPPIVFEISDAYNRTLFSKISNIGNFDQICFDSLTTVKVDGQKITLRKELNNIAVVYDNVSSLTNINFESTKLSQLDYNKIEMALDALFESGILKSILPDVLDYVLTNIDSAEGIMGFTIPAEYVPYVQALQIEFKNNKSMDMIKTDIFAFFGIFKTLGESGVLDELQKDEITLENILTAVNKDERIVVTNVVSNLLNSNFAKAILIEVLNQGLMTLDSLDENVQIPQIDKSQVNWTQVKSELNSVLNAMLDIYDNLKANVGIGTLEELKLKPTRILNVDTDKLTTSLSTIFEQLQNSHLLVSNSEEKIYNKLIDLFENSEYSKYVDLTVFKQQDSWQTELGYLNTSLKNIKNSGVIPVIIDSNVDYELAVDKIAAKDPEDNKTFVRKIVSPLLESKAFARMLNVGFGFLDQLISTYQSQLGENVELGKIQAETFSEDAEKELVVTFFENMVVYAEELNLTELKSDAFSAIITSNLARLGDALDSIKASKLFGEYIEEDLSENEGIYVNLINALANNPDFNRFADFEVAKDASFSWNAELSLLQDAIDTLNNIKINIDGTEKTFLIAIKDGDDISAIFENLSAEGNDIEKIVNPLSESKLMKKNLTLIINTMNEELSKTLNVEISEVDSGLDLSQEKQTVVDVLKLIISLYPEFSDGVSDEILEENYNSIGELLNKMLSSKLSEGVFTNTYNGFIEYLQTSEEYGQRITFLLSEYENEQDVNWIEILSIAIDSKNYTSGEISDDLKNKLASLVETVYNDEQCGDIMATLIEIMNNFITIDNATAETSLQLLIDTFADLEQYNDDYEKVHKVITFTSKITGATALDEIKNITNFTTEKQRYTQLLDTLDEFNESPSVQALESLISQLSEADFAVDTMIKNDIVFDVDDTYKTAVSEYIDNNIEDETVSANLKTIFAI